MNEDELRDIVRSELILLTAKLRPPEKKGLWLFVNTSFGLWLLASILLGGATFFYSNISAAHLSRRAHQERTERLDAEVELRFRHVLGAIKSVQTLRAEIQQQRHSQHPEIRLGPTTLTTDDTKLVFNKPTEDEVFLLDFANHTVQSLFAEGYHLARTPQERKAIKAAISEIEFASAIQHATILLERGIIPPGYDAGSSASPEEIAKSYGTKEALSHALIEELYHQEIANDWTFGLEKHIRNAFDYWERRRTIKDSELPTWPDDKATRVAKAHESNLRRM